MLDLIGGLPVHILVIHAVVVLAPLTSALLVAHAASRRARGGYAGALLPALAVVTGISGLVAASSGEALAERLRRTETDPAALHLINEHAEAGDLARILCLVLMITALAVWWLLRRRDAQPLGRGLHAAVLAVAVLVGVGATGTVVYAGHAGSKAVWSDQVGQG